MGLFGFGKQKKTPEEILAEGRELFRAGDMRHMFLTLHGLANKGNAEACYYIGIYWLKEKGNREMAERYLTTAARGGQAEAAKLLTEQSGEGGVPPQEPESVPAPPVPETPETLYQKGMKEYAYGNYAEAFPQLQRAAEQGHGKALLQCAEMCQRGEGVEKDLRQALTLAEKAKAQNVPGASIAHMDIAKQYILEDGGSKKPAVKISSPAPAPKAEVPKPAPAPKAEAPKPAPAPEKEAPKPAPAETDEAQKRLAQMGNEAFDKAFAAYKEKNYLQALPLFEKAAGLGSVFAQFILGEMYYEGEGTEVDYAKALTWYEKAAQQGHANAQNSCGRMYEYGEGTAVDYTKAFMWYEKAAQQGHTKAQFSLGVLYDEGSGTAKDKAKALMWFEKVAQQGVQEAQFLCGQMYDRGEGTAVDKVKALMWYEESAQRGEATAQLNCGVMYYNGEGTAVDKAKAKMWLMEAATQTEDEKIQRKAREVFRKYF